jgi:hypothetical protein
MTQNIKEKAMEIKQCYPGKVPAKLNCPTIRDIM